MSSIGEVTSHHESVELIQEHIISTRESISRSELESNLNDVGDILLSLEVGNKLTGINLDEDEVTVLGNSVDTVFLGVLSTNEDGGIGDLSFINKSAGGQFVDQEETTLAQTEELTVFGADLHVDGEISREIGIERIFGGTFVFLETLRRSR